MQCHEGYLTGGWHNLFKKDWDHLSKMIHDIQFVENAQFEVFWHIIVKEKMCPTEFVSSIQILIFISLILRNGTFSVFVEVF